MFSRETTVDDMHQTRHLLRNKGVSKSIAAANIRRSAEAQTPPTARQRNNTLQTGHQTNSQADGSNAQSQRLR